MSKSKKLKITITCLLIGLIISTIYGLVFTIEYPEVVISQEKLYSEEQNIKDFELNGVELVAISNDPWINYSLEENIRIAIFQINVSALNAMGGEMHIFDTDSWQEQVKIIHTGDNYIMTYQQPHAWESQHLRFDFVEVEGATINVSKIVINPGVSVWTLGFFKAFIFITCICLGCVVITCLYRELKKYKLLLSKYLSWIGILIISIISSYFVINYFRLVNNNTVFVICTVLITILFSIKIKNISNREKLWIVLFSVLLGLANILGYHIQVNGMQYTGLIYENYISDYGWKDIIALPILTFAIYRAILVLLLCLQRLNSRILLKGRGKVFESHGTFILPMFFILISWVPYLLVYYPGFILGDSWESIWQALEMWMLNNHHPVMYTMLIKLCIFIGKLFGDITFGCAVYSVVQMLYLSYALGKEIEWLRIHGCSWKICIVIMLYFGLTPFFGQVSIAMWKDPIFSASILLWTLLLLNYIESNGEIIKSDNYFVLKNIILLLVICFSRNNGVYVVAFCVMTFIFMHLMKNKNFILSLRKLIAICTLTIMSYFIITGPIYTSIGIVPSEKVESVGMFLNQMARVAAYNGNMSEKNKAFMENLLPLDKYDDAYRPCAVDLLKWDAEFNGEYLNEHMTDFVDNYVSMGINNPKIYVDGWELVTYGYWAPNRWELFNDVNNITKGNLNDLPNSGLTISPHNLLSNTRFDWTILFKDQGSIINLAIVNWIVLFTLLIAILKRKWTLIIALAPSIGVIATLLIASPYYYWQRYGLAEYYMLPIYIFLIICYSGKLNLQSENEKMQIIHNERE